MLGFNFEINEAIVLMLENIEDLESIRTAVKAVKEKFAQNY